MRRLWLPILMVASSLTAPHGAVRAEAPADSTYWILLERGDSLRATEMQLGWGDFVRYRRPDGSIAHVSASRIARIVDANGEDRWSAMLRSRKGLGFHDDLRSSSLDSMFGDRPRFRTLRFQGADRSRCEWYLLTELGILYQFEPDVGRGRDMKSIGVVDMGMMKNVGPRTAVGVSGFHESGADYGHAGLRLRYRRWLAGPLCAELSPGIVLSGDDSFHAPGLIGQATINAGDLVSLVAEGEVSRYSETAGDPATQRHSTKTRYRVGIRGGSYMTVVATAVGAIAFAIWLASGPDLGL